MSTRTRLLAAALWLPAAMTWGSIAHAFAGVPDLGLPIGVTVSAAILLRLPERISQRLGGREAARTGGHPGQQPARREA